MRTEAVTSSPHTIVLPKNTEGIGDGDVAKVSTELSPTSAAAIVKIDEALQGTCIICKNIEENLNVSKGEDVFVEKTEGEEASKMTFEIIVGGSETAVKDLKKNLHEFLLGKPFVPFQTVGFEGITLRVRDIDPVTDIAVVGDDTDIVLEIPGTYRQRIVILLDKSGSLAEMVGQISKIELYKQMFSRFSDVKIRLLKTKAKDSEIAIVTHDTEGIVALPFTPLDVDTPVLIKRKISDIKEGGGTSIGSGFEKADELLSEGKKDFPLKYVVYVGDGAENTPPYYREAVETLARKDVIITVVAVGEEKNQEYNPQLLKEIAATGKGEFIECTGPDSAVALFAHLAAKIKTVVEKPK